MESRCFSPHLASTSPLGSAPQMPDGHHNTIFPLAARKAFRALFAVQPPPT